MTTNDAHELRLIANPEPEPVSEWEDIRAILWVPDPEKRWGWREYYVRTPTRPKKPGVYGFGRNS